MLRQRHAVLALLFVMCLALPRAGWTASHDPQLRWRTLQTEHFNIHFHQGIERVAEDMSDVVEDVYDTLVPEIGWTPRRRTEVVLIDRTDVANGFASIVPYNAITVFVTAPTENSVLNLYEDWNRTLFTHEFAHILHLDAHHGIVSVARAIVGRTASTNTLSPLWMTEGFATYQETRHTPAGRGRAPWAHMIKRTAVAENAFPPLGNLDGLQPQPPAGNLRYLFGQDFIQHIAQTRGEETWNRWLHKYGSSVPFFFPSKRVFGDRFGPLYREWRSAFFERYNAQIRDIRAGGIREGSIVSDPDASCVAPAFSPDGQTLIWSCLDLNDGPAIWRARADGTDSSILIENRGASHFAWRSDSKAFAYAARHIVNQFNTWSDIYLHTIDGPTVALTQGARARDPSFRPDGGALLLVTNRAQTNQISELRVDRTLSHLTQHTDSTQVSTPTISPDGERMAASVWQEGQRDLWIMSTDGTPRWRVTDDVAIDADPAWSADSRWLYFSSDRSGVPNIYALDLTNHKLWQVTHVVTGATKPSLHPDGNTMAYMHYANSGWTVRVMPLDPSRFIDRGFVQAPPADSAPQKSPNNGRNVTAVGSHVPPKSWDHIGIPIRRRVAPAIAPGGGARQDAEVLDAYDDANVDDAFGDEQDFPFTIPPRRYNPFPTLVPRHIQPAIQTTPFRPAPRWDATCIDEDLFCPGIVASLRTGSSDALRRFAWGAGANYRTDADAFSVSGAITLNRFLPVYSLGGSSSAVAGTRLVFVDAEQPETEDGDPNLFVSDPPTIYWERRNSVFASVSWPYRLRTTVFARYSFTERKPLIDLPANVHLPSLPLQGFVGRASAGWRYSWSRPTAYAISPEDGRAFQFVGALLAPALGTFVRDPGSGALEGLTQVQIATEIREYRVLPYGNNHVVAARAATGLTLGTSEFLGNYQLGGSFGDGGFSVTPDSFRMLRGYPFASDVGDMYWLASIEYRLPIWHVHRGVGTLPAYGRNLSALLFVDTGNAFDNPSVQTGMPSTARAFVDAAFDRPLAGWGAEIVWRAVIGYRTTLQGRIGYGLGLTSDGFRFSDGLQPLYARVGASF